MGCENVLGKNLNHGQTWASDAEVDMVNLGCAGRMCQEKLNFKGRSKGESAMEAEKHWSAGHSPGAWGSGG